MAGCDCVVSGLGKAWPRWPIFNLGTRDVTNEFKGFLFPNSPSFLSSFAVRYPKRFLHLEGPLDAFSKWARLRRDWGRQSNESRGEQEARGHRQHPALVLYCSPFQKARIVLKPPNATWAPLKAKPRQLRGECVTTVPRHLL